jgi:uncharacterized protein (TIGR02611 family)
MNEILLSTLKRVKRLVIAVIGFTILLIGVAMIALPGPAFIVIPIGLGILATEFVWAKKLLKKVKEEIDKKKNNFRGFNAKK